MAQVITSHLAKHDIEDIWNYLADDDFEKADNFVRELSRVSRLLSENPGAGRTTHRLINGLRRFAVRRYLIYYFAVPEGIEIYRIIHTSRNIEGMFEDYFENL